MFDTFSAVLARKIVHAIVLVWRKLPKIRSTLMRVVLQRVFSRQLRLNARKMSTVEPKTLEVDPQGELEPRRGEKRKISEAEDAAEEATNDPDMKDTKRNRQKDPLVSSDSEYYFENGLRKVYPYSFRYLTHAKGRWIGRQLVDIFANEFRARPKEYYEAAIKSGQIQIGGREINMDYRLKNNDLMSNDSHRHEVPVIGCPIKIIHDDENMLVVDKPPSVPVHPCGRYRLNSVLYILQKENGYRDLHTLHRLDRLTSGVLMFAKTKERSKYMDELIKNLGVKKQYLCRVHGEFPDSEIVVDKPIQVYSFKIGVCGVDDKGRDATTVFKKLSYNGKSSVVLAQPKHGRMHQIRVHLQYLGYPIVNDPLYNDEAFGKNKAKGGLTEKTPDELVETMLKIHTLENWLTPLSDEELAERKNTYGSSGADANTSESSPSSSANDFFKNFPKNLEHYITDDFRKTLRGYDRRKMEYVESCPECNQKYTDPSPSDLVMYLHCYKYEGADFQYCSSWPNWAKDDWDTD